MTYEQKERTAPNTGKEFIVLPLELIEEITSLLKPTDLCAIRPTCKALSARAFTPFWKRFLHTIKTDFSLHSLQILRGISKHLELWHYVHHLTIKGFDKNSRILGEGFHWDRHANPQEHPAVKQLQGILCQLDNCKSFEIFTLSTRNGDPLSDFTDAITALLDIVTKAGLPVESFTANFIGDAKPMGSNSPYLKKLQASNSQCVAVGAHLEELKLRCRITPDTINDWTLDMIFHAPKLRKLILASDNVRFDCPDFIEHFSETDAPWPQLGELELSLAQPWNVS